MYYFDDEKLNTEDYFYNNYKRQNNYQDLFDNNISSLIGYTGDEFDELDVDVTHVEKMIFNKNQYLAMKQLPLKEKEILYYISVKGYSLNTVSKIMNLSKKEISKLKEQAIKHFKSNLKRISKRNSGVSNE